MGDHDNPHWLIPAEAHASYADYCRAHGGERLDAILEGLRPIEILAKIQTANLRGRGGAGFPAGTKWAAVAASACNTRYVVCNAAEGEPGTFKDRYLLARSPYATLEGMLLAARVVGAKEIYLATKASFVALVARLRRALEELESTGLLSGLQFNLVEGPEEYLFGEEKALLNVIDGEGPFPREAHSPPYQWGIRASLESPNPTLVNNVETFAHAATIVRHGPEGFLALGTRDTPGTVLCTVSGDVRRPGVYEVEAGLPLRRILEEYAGGALPNRELRAVFCGAATAVIPEERFDTPCDFGSMQMAGAGLGSAGFIVVDDATSIPRALQSLTRFLYVESCGLCPACKRGLQVASAGLDGLFEPDPPDIVPRLARIGEGAASAPQGNRCYLPVQGATLVPSVLKRFSADFEPKKLVGSEPFVLPKITSYDEVEHRFTYDLSQLRKHANWEYDPAPGREHPAPAPATARLAKFPPHSPLTVTIAEDVAKLFDFVGADDLAEQINENLRRSRRELEEAKGGHSTFRTGPDAGTRSKE